MPALKERPIRITARVAIIVVLSANTMHLTTQCSVLTLVSAANIVAIATSIKV